MNNEYVGNSDGSSNYGNDYSSKSSNDYNSQGYARIVMCNPESILRNPNGGLDIILSESSDSYNSYGNGNYNSYGNNFN
jgi:hypothetical protein